MVSVPIFLYFPQKTTKRKTTKRNNKRHVTHYENRR